ncbi:CLUMA_CG002787, isoform A [Clunio marinus]|uniref:CLUMA_CG002787, isoform A n=1 Tax=Clunio marinus TaxID=568069 RepID=A0A1J1HM25_9DIPT|nr:CLUMA_CG002787, isoform A [Clunio marinus]
MNKKLMILKIIKLPLLNTNMFLFYFLERKQNKKISSSVKSRKEIFMVWNVIKREREVDGKVDGTVAEALGNERQKILHCI